MNIQVPAWVSNGVVVSDSNGYVQYHPRCPYCGYVDNRSTYGIYVAQSRGAISGSGPWECPKCHKSSDTKAGR